MTASGVVEVYEMLGVLVRALVDHPDEVQIVIVPQNSGILFRVNADPTDIGKIVGIGGRTARHIRAIVLAAGLKHKLSCLIDFVELGKRPKSATSIRQATRL